MAVCELCGKRRTVGNHVSHANNKTKRQMYSIMPQVVAVWCEEEGHDVFMAYHSGYLNMVEPLPDVSWSVCSKWSLATSWPTICWARSTFTRARWNSL